MKKILLALVLTLLPSLAFAQSQRNPCYYPNDYPNSGCESVGGTTPMLITGSNNILTYSSGIGNLANTGAGDILCIAGSATKTVKVKAFRISADATAAIVVDALVIKRSALNTGGTTVAITPTPHDSNNAAATATVTAYSVSPTPGTAVGTLRGVKLAVGLPGNTTQIGDEKFEFFNKYDQPIVLRGINQSACVNVTAMGAGASIDVGVEHTEE